MTVEQALSWAQRRGLQQLVLVGYDEDDDFVLVSASNEEGRGLSRADTSWALQQANAFVLGLRE